ncbi:MAG: peptidoglycan binding protein CsiV [Gammaproteobacteria bacterium]|nr:peptidoglycan binding protein CsiV [Gammaproteobacteria bacterium]
MCKANTHTYYQLKPLVICFLTFALSCTRVFSAPLPIENWYQVEVLIFRYDIPFEATQEQWPKNIKRSFPYNLSVLETQASKSDRGAFRTLSPKLFSFSGYEQELKRKKGIRTLYHAAWHQPRLDKTVSLPLLIQGGHLTEDNQFELEGSIRISIKRYIHIETDLWLSSYQPKEKQTDYWQEFSSITGPLPYKESVQASENKLNPSRPSYTETLAPLPPEQPLYRTKYIAQMQQTRRMNRDELHYLDHPLFGLLVRTIRYEQPGAEPISLEKPTPAQITQERNNQE